MCTNCRVPDKQLFSEYYGTPAPLGVWRDEVYKDYFAPIIRRDGDGRRSDLASFGMVPREKIPPGVRVFDTMNARAETVGAKRTQTLGAQSHPPVLSTPQGALRAVVHHTSEEC